MQRVLTLILTSVVVSLDSFVAGFSISLNKRQNIVLPSIVALATFVMCLISALIGYVVKGLINDRVDVLSAVILTVLAVANILKEDVDDVNGLQSLTLSECIAVGVAVGLDASVANLSLAIAGYGIAAPIVLAVTHFFTVLAGQRLAGKITLSNTNILSAFTLLALAVMRLI